MTTLSLISAFNSSAIKFGMKSARKDSSNALVTDVFFQSFSEKSVDLSRLLEIIEKAHKTLGPMPGTVEHFVWLLANFHQRELAPAVNGILTTEINCNHVTKAYSAYIRMVLPSHIQLHLQRCEFITAQNVVFFGLRVG